MQIDTDSRLVQLSVGELAAFRCMPKGGASGGGRWRAELGQEWHREAARLTAATQPTAAFEQSISGTLLHRKWTLRLQGRIDQVIPQLHATLLREVKTVREQLPCAPEDLLENYPEYFAQAAIYLRLAKLSPEFDQVPLSAELLFIEISSGMTQLVPLPEHSDQLLIEPLDQLLDFLDDRRARKIHLQEMPLLPAFPVLRPGQPELIQQLAHASLKSKIVLLQAPTGFGKTGIVLEHALRQMQEGLFERCIYLSTKSTGQLETLRQLRCMVGDHVRYIQMRNRAEHRIDTARHQCTGDSRCDQAWRHSWLEAEIQPQELFQHGTLDLDRAKDLGSQTGVCPYALTRSCLPFADVWIGDSNYLFAPQSRHVFGEVSGFDPSQTLLIIDEAHNLASRNADALSVEMDAQSLFLTIEELRAVGAPRPFISCLEKLGRDISQLTAEQTLGANQIYAFLDLCEECVQHLRDGRFDSHALAPFALDRIWRIPELASCLEHSSDNWLHWCPSPSKLRAQCLDASAWTAECIMPFASCMLMSATLEPLDRFHSEIGIDASKTSLAIGWAPWREEAYRVAIDCRVDTRLKHREKFYATTADTIRLMAASTPGEPLVAFFPSYQYAANVQAYLSVLDPYLRVTVQPRGMELQQQELFLQESLLSSDALFLIMGSSYAEGIDTLGGRVRSLVVVGPALPEVSPVQKAKMEKHPSSHSETAFLSTYLVPAMRRIHQALGRIVRAPGQEASVLLHCKRFAEDPYFRLLQPEYQSQHQIHNDRDLLNWLKI